MRAMGVLYLQYLAVGGVFAVVGAAMAALELFAGWPKYVTYPLGLMLGLGPAWSAWAAVGRRLQGGRG